MQQSGLPSKKFIIRGAIATALLAIILIVQTDWFHALFNKKSAEPAPERTTDIVGKDTNGNGIADWEERLWGLDPNVLYTNGRPNADIIKEKKTALGIKTVPDSELSRNDSIAQKLFILSASLGQESGVSNETLDGAARTIGESVRITNVTNHYSSGSIKRVATTIPSIKAYYAAMATTTAKLSDGGPDIDALVQSLETGDFSTLAALDSASTEYRALAEKIRTISVPIGLAQEHLNIMNGLYGVADSFQLIQTIQTDGFEGLAGIAAYKRYSELLQNALFEEHKYFISYGIL
jgi:hypothetical protein